MSGLTAVRSGSIAAVDLSEPLQFEPSFEATYFLTAAWVRIVGAQYQWGFRAFRPYPRVIDPAPGPSSVPVWTAVQCSYDAYGRLYVLLGAGQTRYVLGTTSPGPAYTANSTGWMTTTVTTSLASPSLPSEVTFPAPEAGQGTLALPRTARRGGLWAPWRRRG